MKKKIKGIFYKKSSKIALLCVFISLAVYFTIGRTVFFYRIKNKIQRIYSKREPWITIFIHGNFNTGLGFLSFRDVLKDNLKNTTYRKLIKKIRKDPFFYQEQPILNKGLVQIEPSFELPKTGEKFAAYPILKAYKEILEVTHPGKENNYFYTFGWSGLMSQTVRKRWAIRLYNALSETVEQFKEIGLSPKIRIIAHSHGGNVALSLSLVKDILHNVSYKEISAEGKQYLSETSTLIKKLPPKKSAKGLKGQKKFDYAPINKELQVDELIVLGTPLQVETYHCFKSDIFKKIYSIYSEQDVVQGMDFVTSKQRTSKQRFEEKEYFESNLVQAKITIDQKPGESSKEKENASWWNKIGQIFGPGSKDPTHKDLWFLAWNPDFCQPGFPLNPLPLVIITPVLIKALEKTKIVDVDLNLMFLKKKLEVNVTKHNGTKLEGKTLLPLAIINDIKAKTMPWKPGNLTRANTFKKMYAQL